VLALARADGSGTGTGAAPTAGTPSTVAPATKDSSARTLGTVGIVLGIAGLLVGATGFLRGRATA
jgi:hypothetical protein